MSTEAPTETPEVVEVQGLREATALRQKLLRQGVQDVRKRTAGAAEAAKRLIAEGQPGNGLEDALEQARKKLAEAEEILERVEGERFKGQKGD